MEVHGPTQNANPVLTAGTSASVTTGISIGAAVALHYWNPLRLAKDLHLLNILFPNRVGVAVTPGSFANDATAAALRCKQGEPSYMDKATDLLRYLRTPVNPAGQANGVSICHRSSSNMRAWVCTVNEDAALNARLAAFAAAQAVGFVLRLTSFGAGVLEHGADVVARYRGAFIADSSMCEPGVAVICPAICGVSDGDAHATWSRMRAASASLELAVLNPGAIPQSAIPPAMFPIGGPETCRQHLADLAARLNATELLVSCIADTFDGILHAYSLLSAAFGLARRDGT